jgi:hypothetical protein
MLDGSGCLMVQDVGWFRMLDGSGCCMVQDRIRRIRLLARRLFARAPQKALCGGIPGSFLEPLARSWSHFVGIYRQKSTRSLGN